MLIALGEAWRLLEGGGERRVKRFCRSAYGAVPGGNSGTDTFAELPFRVATNTAVERAVTAPAVRMKMALILPERIVTDVGIVTFAELAPKPRATLTGLAAADTSVTTQIALAGVVIEAGRQPSLET